MFNFNNTDSERTMCTFLGIAGKINENDVDVNIVKNSEITFLKDIFGMRVSQKKHLRKLLKIQKKLPCHYLINFVWIDIKHIS